jgi:hypothetical protein
MTLHSVLTPALVAFAAFAGPAISRADINLYTFEAPQFTVGETTPIGPTAPNSGDPSFTTTFANAGTQAARQSKAASRPHCFPGNFWLREFPVC